MRSNEDPKNTTDVSNARLSYQLEYDACDFYRAREGSFDAEGERM